MADATTTDSTAALQNIIDQLKTTGDKLANQFEAKYNQIDQSLNNIAGTSDNATAKANAATAAAASQSSTNTKLYIGIGAIAALFIGYIFFFRK